MIRSLVVEPVRITPARAELVVRVELDGASGVEIRGALVGPRCADISTIEVAYPLRSVGEPDALSWTLRVVIPEPNLWSPAAPFRYDGRVEVWRGEEKLADHPFAVELRPPQKTDQPAGQ